MSEAYDPDNLLDRHTSPATLAVQDEQIKRREQALLARRLPLAGGDVLAVGCGWHPGRHMFPAPAFRLVGVDVDPAKVKAVVEGGEADEAVVGRAGELAFPDASFDVVLYRLALHHIAYQGSLDPSFAEAARLLRPGGAMIAVEPGLWHPVGGGLALANRTGVATRIHGTPDDIPLSPRALHAHARRAGLVPELHAVTYTWRRLPPALQRALGRLDALGSLPGLRAVGHTLMLLARKPLADG
jgi:SAM-dependent methyltransferase